MEKYDFKNTGIPDSKVATKLPIELIMKVMQETDWYALMALRKTCKFFYQISKETMVWRSQFHRYRAQHKYTPSLTLIAPLETYSAAELEDWISFRMSADAGWVSKSTQPTRVRNIKNHVKVSTSALIPGGRWLLVGGHDGSVVVYDLDKSTPQGKVLAQHPCIALSCIAIDIDIDSPTLAFIMALAAVYSGHMEDANIHMWAVHQVGGGEVAFLEANHLKSFSAHGVRIFHSISLRGRLFGRMSKYRVDDTIELFDWDKSSSSLRCKAVITLHNQAALHIHVLPGNRVLVFSRSLVTIYQAVSDIDVQTISKTTKPPAHMDLVWQHASASKSIVYRGPPKPLSDNTSTTLIFYDSRLFYYLVVRHDTLQLPQCDIIASYDEPFRYGALAFGSEKAFCDNGDGRVLRFEFLRKSHESATQNHRAKAFDVGVYSASEYPHHRTPRLSDLTNYLDEESGRIVQ
ncbi:hypothetical protein H0H81_003595, partial [Sphagnurus paluster]